MNIGVWFVTTSSAKETDNQDYLKTTHVTAVIYVENTTKFRYKQWKKKKMCRK